MHLSVICDRLKSIAETQAAQPAGKDCFVMAKIKDVAKLAGVSTSTVSLVLNHKGYVSEATRAKVESAVEKLQYVPSEVGRNLSLNRTNLIGVIIPDVAHPFFAALLHEIEIALYDLGYKTMICST